MDVEVEVEVEVEVDVDVDVDVLVDVVVVVVDVVVVEALVVRRPAARIVVPCMSCSSVTIGRNPLRRVEVLVVDTNPLVVAVRKRPGSGVAWS